MKKAITIALAIAGAVAISSPAVAGGFSVGKCKACHAVNKNKVGPAWKDVAAVYGSPEALAAMFKEGFKNPKFAAANPKWKGKVGLMRSQYKRLIKGHEDEAAKALFEAVKRGKI